MNDNAKPWRTYEEVAQYLLNEFAAHFRLGHVEGKQVVPGQSGADWEIDAKGVAVNGEAFVIVECRRRTTSNLAQGSMGELAYRIIDTGASGGILVTPLDLQSGAKKVAGYSNIQHVTLDPNATTTEYVLRFLNRTFTGRGGTCSLLLKESVSLEVIQDCKVVEKRYYQ
jgi:hypothetical protein